MSAFPPTVILRHRKENLKKCSLRGLESRNDFKFYKYPLDSNSLHDLTNYIMLSVDAEPLTFADSNDESGLLILDGTWRLCERMQKLFLHTPRLIKRSLPNDYRTAYPRRQEDCADPERGLASIEAIYVAYMILGRDTTGLLEHYYWKEAFLEKNANHF